MRAIPGSAGRRIVTNRRIHKAVHRLRWKGLLHRQRKAERDYELNPLGRSEEGEDIVRDDWPVENGHLERVSYTSP